MIVGAARNKPITSTVRDQWTYLFQQCLLLRARLARIPELLPWFSIASQRSSRRTSDPVNQLWDLFAFGVPLCLIFNLLAPPKDAIEIDLDPGNFDVDDIKTHELAISLFVTKLRAAGKTVEFTEIDLRNRHIDGLFKTIKAVIDIVDNLPEHVFDGEPSSFGTHQAGMAVESETRRAGKRQAVKDLQDRVVDWKGHDVSRFGDLLLDDIFVVEKSEVNREYHIFVFEKIILCCTETPLNGPKMQQENIGEQPGSISSAISGPVGQTSRSHMPLALKGRIFIANLIQSVIVSGSDVRNKSSLEIWWRSDDGLEFLTILFHTSEQRKQWHMKICQLIGNAPRIKIEREPQQKSASDKISQYGKSESPLPVLGDSSDSQEEKPAVNPAELPNGTGPPNLCRKTLQNSVDDSVRAGRLPPLHCTNVAGILCDLDFPTGPTSLSWLKASQNQLLFALGYPSGSGLIIVQEICLAIVADTVIYQRLLLYTCAHIIRFEETWEIRLSNIRDLQETVKTWKELNAIETLINHRKMRRYLWDWLRTSDTAQSHTRRKCFEAESMNDILLSDMKGIANQASHILQDRTSRKCALSLQGNDAQALVDLLHALLTYCCSDKVKAEKNPFYKALLKLCEGSKLYPTCLALRQVDLSGKDAEAGGGFADVWKHEFEGRFVAIKAVRIYANSEAENVAKAFSLEAVKWAHLSHPNILRFHGIFYLNESRSRIGFVSPWCENGTIVDYLKAHPATARMPLLLDAARGMSYLHGRSPSVVHGDLKGANILINSAGRACLADFGFLKVIAESQYINWTTSTAQSSGTMRWMAPELIVPCLEPGCDDKPRRNTRESDIYSLACVSYETFSGKVPFHACPNDPAIIWQVMQGQRPPRPSTDICTEFGLDDVMWKLVEDCWQTKPAERPTANDIVKRLETRMNDPYFPPQDLDTSFTRAIRSTLMHDPLLM